ncbi:MULTISPECIES: cytochrome-c oxidase, cbb3-type subunit II [Devosia]|uniref:Cytochrome C oxidase, mono-heme subunit/FixO n=1 Tax=Devosia equisanguinis TaxID=2490941 RepID=A0A3S4GH56_9HYPH|nr:MULTISPECIES: cytochrome-c oxidase, cbb3-type subunit II [Devosia]ODT51017.1 MAG: cytochrome-c oxidase, cbb3-type subunit II [Pelagibacterium sp. SCN 63-126]ODU84571.1 MAG: cytochrome-c oxidase, cbb3-type subunit II [Pelagibacterium sp. SCN 63-17]OJX44324.1 MAG: cytochrome-c oxidase, cbb3-type subunit II [Devosia sp. 63-57]VDS03041.1 Cytochrome C oxidase, mono-heme subunit/FixO [Devosia equisanguinis]
MFINHGKIETSAALLILLTLVTIGIGGIVQAVPLFTVESTIEPVEGVRPYTPLELYGRNIYTREGCYTCHSQMVRPFVDEVERYGHFSLAAESQYDHPFLWGSKRTGPDLARVGARYSNAWHEAHLINPRDLLPSSIMPPYAFLRLRELKTDDIGDHMRTLRLLGTPYTDAQIGNAQADILAQARPDEHDTESFLERWGKAPLGRFTTQDHFVSEMDALIAYLQVLGTMADLSTYDPATMSQQQ